MVNVLIHTDTRYPVNRKIIRSAAQDTFKKFKIENANLEVSVAVVGARKMKQLGDKYAGDGKKHQILTFALEEDPQNPRVLSTSVPDSKQKSESYGFVNPPNEVLKIGDIVLCWPQVLMEASEDEMMVDDKVYELVCHGINHLLGQDHDESPIS